MAVVALAGVGNGVTTGNPGSSVAVCWRHFLVSLVWVVMSGVVQAQEIWFAPQAAPVGSRLHRASDLMDLFRPDSPWQVAAGHVKVFKLYASYLSGAPQDELDAIVGDLNRRHILIALEVGVMNIGPKATNPPCGGLGQVEGYGTPQLAKANSEKIKRAGGMISFVAMDEPLFFGHYFRGKPGGQPGCLSSIEQMLALIKEPLSVYRDEFPGIVIGDTEPSNIAEQTHWQEDLLAWATGFRQTMGKPLAFMHLDIPFNRPNEESYAVQMFKYVDSLKSRGLIDRTGIIYNGTPLDESDAAWVKSAKDKIHLLEDSDGLRPDQALIQSWTEFPQHALPDSSDSSLTGLVNFYARRAK